MKTYTEFINEKFDYTKQRNHKPIQNLKNGDELYIIPFIVNSQGKHILKYPYIIEDYVLNVKDYSNENEFIIYGKSNHMYNCIKEFIGEIMDYGYGYDGENNYLCVVSTQKEILEKFMVSKYLNEFIKAFDKMEQSNNLLPRLKIFLNNY